MFQLLSELTQKLNLPTFMAKAGLGPQAFSPWSDLTTKAAASLGGGYKSRQL